MATSPLAESIGALAGLCSMASFAPQLVKLWRERNGAAISLRMYAITVAGFVLWTAYGVLIESPAVIAANSVCLMLSTAILVLKWRFSRDAGREKDSLNHAS